MAEAPVVEPPAARTEPVEPEQPVDPVALPELTDDELTAFALATDRTDVAGDEAISYWDVVAPRDLGLLPGWYMPSPSAGTRRLVGWRRRVVFLVTGSIVVINAVGLCITYGHVTLG
ncbi:hypothetical protein KSP35_20950 [Aquihabitans sp. G128]|uniref:hypothetical protein n=1 Tax=Aquihabitans sp. G128 TaxID=2849779 RepID=UPI001C235FC4|nr:hypothetical protein [Aquihabitans sp. G128]QXC60761.1 hypothetical protein KSP35_20950 [Aquihabitans sp. G128]